MQSCSDIRLSYYSENLNEATNKFIKSLPPAFMLKWAPHPHYKSGKFDIPYASIGDGPNKIVINSGIHGIEGYFGSAAQIMFLNELAAFFTPEILKKYTFVFIHIINAWGLENRMREVRDSKGGLVDLNRNFGINFSDIKNLPENKLYRNAHDILLSKPHVAKGASTKYKKLCEFRKNNLKNGVWDSIKNGQYYEPYGLYYGGSCDMPENKMTMSIYDDVMRNATSLLSIGLHTGLGRFYKKKGIAGHSLEVSHPSNHPNTIKLKEIFGDAANIIPEENAINGPVLLGDLVDCLESRYKSKNIPILTTDMEIGTGQWPIRSQVLKRMDMGDARYDLLNSGVISEKTKSNLTESWYPSDNNWRLSALNNAHGVFIALLKHLKTK